MAVQTNLLTSNRNVTRQILDQETVVKAYVDCDDINLTSGDYYRLFYYDANTLITFCQVVVETLESAAGGETLDITDDESGTTTLVNNVDLNTLGVATVYTTSIFKTTAGYISIKPDVALDTGKIWVVAKLAKLTTSD